MVFLFLPVLIKQPYKKLFHGHLPHAIHIQVRQDPCYVIQQDPVASHNIEIVRPEPFLIIIENKGNPVHRHCCLAGTRHSLDNQVVVRGFPDNLILLLLDRGHNFSQYRLLVFGKVFGEKIVIGNHLTVKIIQELPILYFIGTLQPKVNFHLHAPRRSVTASAQAVFVIGVSHRGTPVHHHPVGGIFGNSAPSYIKGFLLPQRFIPENDPAKVRLIKCLFIPGKGTLHMGVHGNRII